MTHPGVGRRAGLVASAVLALVTVAACSSSSNGGSGGSGKAPASLTSNASQTITVWTDSTREAGFKEYQQAHPNVKMQITTYDQTSLLTKIQLFNKTGKGWPDLIFDPVPDDIASLASTQYGNYATPLQKAIPSNVLSGFGAANQPCTIDGNLVCIKNDLAQSVLWYNKTLMDQWGYQVPTTWEQYEALGLQVAKDHPGYVLGSAGDIFAEVDYFVPSGCPLTQTTSENKVTINASASTCTRVATMLDTMIKAGAISKFAITDPGYLKLASQGKVLMMPGSSFFGDFLFAPASVYHYPSGQLAAATMPKWSDQATAYSGSGGGGIYVVSSHSKNQKGAVAIAQWMATSPSFQTTAPTYPAYEPDVAAWAKRLSTDSFYAADPFPAMQQQAELVNPVQQYVRYNLTSAWTTTISQAIAKGSTITSQLPALESQLKQLAQAAGYTVGS